MIDTRPLLVTLATTLVACAGVTRLDYCALASRDGWQRPHDVIRALELAPGARVADLGAGDGYFVPFLADAVGPDGRVFAVDVDVDALTALEERVARQGLERVQVVEASYEDSKLAEASVDLVLLVNTFHHIEDRPAYFRRLKSALAPGARVAIIDPDQELRGVLGLFLEEGHTSRASQLREEMRSAGYHHQASHDFLPIQRFEVFEVDPG